MKSQHILILLVISLWKGEPPSSRRGRSPPCGVYILQSVGYTQEKVTRDVLKELHCLFPEKFILQYIHNAENRIEDIIIISWDSYFYEEFFSK